MEKFEVVFYETVNGSRPVEDFILAQNIKMQVKFFRSLTLLEEQGNNLREPDSKLLSDGIFEIRVKQSNNITRILYFFVIGRKAILTNAFVKKTMKTPIKEIQLAKERRADYFKRALKNE